VPRVIPQGATLYLCPRGLLSGAEAGHAVETGRAVPLAGGPRAFTAIDLLWRTEPGPRKSQSFSLEDFRNWLASLDHDTQGVVERQLSRLRDACPLLSRINPASHARPLVMGILNATPDSFSDGGRYNDPARAIAYGEALVAQGADILDVGGESTRPGATPIGVGQECDRVLPVIEGLKGAGVPISIDTRHAEVMRAALSAGARIINDVTALEGDAGSMAVAIATGAPVALMHMQGKPGTMQDDPRYDDVVMDVLDYLAGRITACEAAGIPRSSLMVDPGIGFGKTSAHCLDLMENLAAFHSLGVPILLGVSRKRFIGAVDRKARVTDRVGGSLAGALAGTARGAQIIRVHDVKETAQAVAVTAAIDRGDLGDN